MKYYVEIVETESGKVFSRIEIQSRERADKLQKVTADHLKEGFIVRVVEEEEKVKE